VFIFTNFQLTHHANDWSLSATEQQLNTMFLRATDRRRPSKPPALRHLCADLSVQITQPDPVHRQNRQNPQNNARWRSPPDDL
jgi:hypothetical protein